MNNNLHANWRKVEDLFESTKAKILKLEPIKIEPPPFVKPQPKFIETLPYVSLENSGPDFSKIGSKL